METSIWRVRFSEIIDFWITPDQLVATAHRQFYHQKPTNFVVWLIWKLIFFNWSSILSLKIAWWTLKFIQNSHDIPSLYSNHFKWFTCIKSTGSYLKAVIHRLLKQWVFGKNFLLVSSGCSHCVKTITATMTLDGRSISTLPDHMGTCDLPDTLNILNTVST